MHRAKSYPDNREEGSGERVYMKSALLRPTKALGQPLFFFKLPLKYVLRLVVRDAWEVWVYN